MSGLLGAGQRWVGSLLGRLLGPADGVAPAAAGTHQPPIASMPESSCQGV